MAIQIHLGKPGQNMTINTLSNDSDMEDSNIDKEEYFIIPRNDIEALEKARKELYEFIGGDHCLTMKLIKITGPMWKLAHCRYPIYKKNYLKPKKP